MQAKANLAGELQSQISKQAIKEEEVRGEAVLLFFSPVFG
jgi:hypothetical protein